MTALIEIQNVSKVYSFGDQPVVALRGVNLTVEEGEHLCIMGASGSGKTTLMNIIGCLDRPTDGIYMLDGKAVQGCTEEELAEVRNAQIGFVFQQFNLLSQLSALENVMLPLVYAGIPESKRQARAEYVLDLVGLSDRLLHRPAQLSGGQQQRVAIARALSNKPKIILADEPTGAVDSQTALELMQLLDRLVEDGTTVVLVTHDAETASHAQRRIVLKDGRIAQETVRELKSKGF
jgi:ABC-type lipoprotein export system ATPase subunit